MIAASNPDARILIVDDEPRNVRVLKRVLAVAGYRQVLAITDPRDAIARFAEIGPDLLLLDLHMPEIDGVAVMERLRAGMPASEYFPILMLTGDASPQACQRALAMGASDFVAKPFDMHEVLIRIRNLLETRFLHRQVAEHNLQLERKVRERTAELDTAQLDTVARLALAAEFRDDETGRHTQRVGALAELLARAMGWSDAEAALLGLAAPLHDIGKIGIPDAILRKAVMLTARERKTMEQHTTIGARILSGGRSSFIQLAEKVALSHHERWDGQGYPERRVGPAIPSAARIVAVADFFDATVHDRVYRKAWPMDEVFAAIAAMSGSAFDPAVAELCSRPEVQESMIVSRRALAPVDISPGSGDVTRPTGYSRNRSERRVRRSV
ncbi:MAG TPA: HD domain-containing phosphohydrolase [Gemmatimonadales bacterium]|jgi:putative two-component system response regulator|nr:HD domain-containing phosphohydrolase [Gemmatimonadales bacterium]